MKCDVCGKEYDDDNWDADGKFKKFITKRYPNIENPEEWAIIQKLPEDCNYCPECAIAFFE